MSDITLEQFLRPLSEALGRDAPPASVARIDTARRPGHVFEKMDEREAVRVFEKEAAKVGIRTMRTSAEGLARAVAETAVSFEAKTAVVPDDQRVDAEGIAGALDEAGIATSRWNARGAAGSKRAAAQADCGITFAEAGIAETATVMQVCDGASGRSICLLPETHIAILRTRDIVAHMAQALERLQNEARKTEAMPSNVTFITGPSNTADIELVRVMGVHGPVNAAVMLVEG